MREAPKDDLFVLFFFEVTDFKAVEGNSINEERNAAYQQGLLLLLLGTVAVLIIFAAISFVVVTLWRKVSFKLIQLLQSAHF